MKLATRTASALAAFCLAASFTAAQSQKPKEDKSFELKTPFGGMSASSEATASEAGLPAYPGARPLKEKDDEDPQAKFSFSTPAFEFKVVALKFETADSVEKVAAFYRKALAKYGQVIECSESTKASVPKAKREDDLDCEESEPKKGGMELKTGKESNQHIVAIEPAGKSTHFALVYVVARKKAKETL